MHLVDLFSYQVNQNFWVQLLKPILLARWRRQASCGFIFISSESEFLGSSLEASIFSKVADEAYEYLRL